MSGEKVKAVEGEVIPNGEEPNSNLETGEPIPPGEGEGEGEEEHVLEIGGSPVPGLDNEEELEKAPAWVKQLRARQKDDAKKIRDLEHKLAEKEKQPVQQPQLPALHQKPTLESHGFDQEAYEADLDKWYGEKRKREDTEREQQQAAERQQNEWNEIVQGHATKRAALKFADVEEADEFVTSKLSVVQNGIIRQGAQNSALVNYALFKDQEELARLAKITDPVKFSVAVGTFEGKLKMTTRKSNAPAPEKTLSGNGGVPKDSGVDKTLERLEAEADKTGDRTKVLAYKRQQRQGKT